jgi:uncharacterized protein (DUF488 family)
VEIYTIGFTQKTAEDFFGRLSDSGVRRVVDVRLRNTGQLSGFAKAQDLPFFLRELVGAEYKHEPLLAPSQELFDHVRKHKRDWNDYAKGYLELLAEREVEKKLDPKDFETPTALLCTEATADKCHRRLVIEYLAGHWPDVTAVHL